MPDTPTPQISRSETPDLIITKPENPKFTLNPFSRKSIFRNVLKRDFGESIQSDPNMVYISVPQEPREQEKGVSDECSRGTEAEFENEELESLFSFSKEEESMMQVNLSNEEKLMLKAEHVYWDTQRGARCSFLGSVFLLTIPLWPINTKWRAVRFRDVEQDIYLV
jgi:hypothetical protein